MRETKRSYSMFGKQRRLSPELKAEIMQRLKSGERPYDVERRYRLCFNTVARLRRLIGDAPAPLGSGRKRKLSAAVLQQAEQRLRAGDGWRHVAADLHVSPQTLYDRVKFRKRDKR
jgi:transposase-like protein